MTTNILYILETRTDCKTGSLNFVLFFPKPDLFVAAETRLW